MPPYGIEWFDKARADVRRLDRAAAMRVFNYVFHYARTGVGNVEPLHGAMAGSFRLRAGDYRIFTLENDTIGIFGVRHRSEAYQ
jgi:mRNA-degrading endonuclease RelE of RelBE toxin-antitoxin system